VILETLATRKVRGVREAMEARGAAVWYLPPYSPDFNPIEPMWARSNRGCAGTPHATTSNCPWRLKLPFNPFRPRIA